MKMQDIKEMDRNDVLALLGLETRQSTAGRLLGTLGTFGIGLLVGAGVGLLLARKPGSQLREEIGARLRREREEDLEAGESNGSGDGAVTNPGG